MRAMKTGMQSMVGFGVRRRHCTPAISNNAKYNTLCLWRSSIDAMHNCTFMSNEHESTLWAMVHDVLFAFDTFCSHLFRISFNYVRMCPFRITAEQDNGSSTTISILATTFPLLHNVRDSRCLFYWVQSAIVF